MNQQNNPMAPSALALDIDGTITTADQRVVNDLVAAARASGAHVAINTARPPRYCDEPSQTLHSAAKADHHCYDGASWRLRNFFVDVPASKVHNMGAIMRNGGVARRECCVLVDDRPENVVAAAEAGYGAVAVEARAGITPRHAREILATLRRCAVDAARDSPAAFGPQRPA